jgi:hypothetical protein
MTDRFGTRKNRALLYNIPDIQRADPFTYPEGMTS